MAAHGSMPRVRILMRSLAPSVLAGILVACQASGAAAPHRKDGSPRMVELLKRITEQSNPENNPFMNAARAELLGQSIKERGDATPRELRNLAVELLNAGKTSEAIAILGRIEGMMRARKTDPRSRPWIEIRSQQAVANLRRAEESNCTMHHNPRSCLFPIRGSGVHTQKEGSQAAVAILSELLEQNPDDLKSRWLLNVAHMTLGEYPEGVPSRWLLAPKLFESDYDIGDFPDIAGELGLDVNDNAGGSIVDDFDGDGYLDIMASAMGLKSQLRYFRNNADGSFTERTQESGLTGLTGGLNIVQTDYNNDARPDVLVLRGGWMGKGGRYPNSLLRNNGDGTFEDVTVEAGVLSFHPTQTAAWLDYDGDGWLDLFIGNESSEGDPHPCELYHNNRNGTFTEVADEAGVALVAFVKGVASADFNNDGRPDLYVSVRGEANRLYRNDGPAGLRAAEQGDWHFTEVAAAAGVTEPILSFPTWFFDFDNDGWEDIFVSGYQMTNVGDVAADYLGLPHQGELPRLYHNNHDETFTDVTQQARLDHVLVSMGSNYGDLDNDGWLDFYVGTGDPNLSTLVPNRMFRNAEGRFFQDVTTSGGFGHLQKGHGVSFADLDNDGDQDIHMVVGGAYESDLFRNALFANPGHGNHWIVLKLEGVKSNRPGIGARIKVVVREPGGEERTIYKTVRSGGSFGASPLRQEIGLGQATGIESVEILWPASGTRQVVQDLEMGQIYQVREGDPVARPIPLRVFRLGNTGSTPGTGP